MMSFKIELRGQKAWMRMLIRVLMNFGLQNRTKIDKNRAIGLAFVAQGGDERAPAILGQ